MNEQNIELGSDLDVEAEHEVAQGDKLQKVLAQAGFGSRRAMEESNRQSKEDYYTDKGQMEYEQRQLKKAEKKRLQNE